MTRAPLLLLLLCALALAACSAPAAVAPDAGPAPDAVIAVTPPAVPYYEVPTSDPALAPHAFFAVPDVHYVVTGGTVTLTYDFPPDLSGVVDQPLVLSGPVDAQGNSTISGPEGTGTCVVAGPLVRCTEIFGEGLALDHAAALDAVATYPGDRGARAAVIDAFVQDPIGIVVFDLAEASEPSGGDDDD